MVWRVFHTGISGQSLEGAYRGIAYREVGAIRVCMGGGQRGENVLPRVSHLLF